MKKYIVARIIIWSVVAVLLTALMIVGIVFHPKGKDIFNNFTFIKVPSVSYSDSDKYSVGDASVSDEINCAEIYWQSGSVTIDSYDGNTIDISETGATDEDGKLRYLIDNGKLVIRYCKSGIKNKWFNSSSKNLTVKVPKDMAESFSNFKVSTVSADADINGFKIDNLFSNNTVSGNFKINNITANRFESDSVSGEITAKDVEFDTVKANTVSGGLDITGKVCNFDSNSTSGSVCVETKSLLKGITCNSVSGDVSLIIPTDNGFTTKYSTVSGDLVCELPTVKSGKNITYGDGSANFDFSTTSGDVTIKGIK